MPNRRTEDGAGTGIFSNFKRSARRAIKKATSPIKPGRAQIGNRNAEKQDRRLRGSASRDRRRR